MERQTEKRFQQSESFAVGALLTVAGGLLDAYTYRSRGGVFANAETGNMVLLGVYLTQGQWRKAVSYLFPIVAYALGVLTAEWIRDHHRDGRRYHWRHSVLLAEVAVVCGASFLPLGKWDALVNVLVAFICAMQVETFRKVRGNPFATTMCTGNLRSGTEALYRGLADRRREAVEKGLCYYAIIACFVAGAVLGVVLTSFAPQRAVLAAAFFLLAAFFLMCRETPSSI